MTQAPATRQAYPGAGAPTPAPAGQGPRRPTTTTPYAVSTPGVPTEAARVRDVARSAFEGTPGRMRLYGAVAAVLAAVFGILGGYSLWSAAGALQRADHNTAQVVQIQGIRADLVRADADATNAFLAGGEGSPELRADYDASLGRVATNIAESAQAQPADGAALGALNQQVQEYAATVEQARAYNRQGLPIGATYLSNASATLRSSALPILDELTKANQSRAVAEFDASSGNGTLLLSGLLSLAVMVWMLFWLATRTHRYLNLPLAVGSVLVLAALLLGSLTLGAVGNRVQTVQNGDFAATLSLASARSAAYDAKSNESLTLIARGSGSAYEKAWQAQSGTVQAQIKIAGRPYQELQTDWTNYVSAHTKIRQLDDSGNWDAAVAAAVAAPSVQGSSNQTFGTFSDNVNTDLTASRADTDAALLGPVGWVTAAGWGLLVLCIGAALLVLRGVSQRADEYR